MTLPEAVSNGMFRNMELSKDEVKKLFAEFRNDKSQYLNKLGEEVKKNGSTFHLRTNGPNFFDGEKATFVVMCDSVNAGSLVIYADGTTTFTESEHDLSKY